MTSTLFNTINTQLATHLASTLNLEEEDVNNALNSFVFVPPTIKTKSAPKATPAKKTPPPQEDEEDNEASDTEAPPPKKTVSKGGPSQCEYIGKKGDKEGVRCTTKAKEANSEGHYFCGTHNSNKAKATKQAKESLNADIGKNSEAPAKGAKTSTSAKTKTGAKTLADEKTDDLVNSLLEKKPLNIKKNKHGNYEDVKTNIVFNKDSRTAIGRQLKDGKIGPLTDEQIEICERENYPFDIVEKKKESKQVVKQPPPKASKTVKVSKPVVEDEETSASEGEDNASEKGEDDDANNASVDSVVSSVASSEDD